MLEDALDHIDVNDVRLPNQPSPPGECHIFTPEEIAKEYPENANGS